MAFQLLGAETDVGESIPPSTRGSRSALRLIDGATLRSRRDEPPSHVEASEFPLRELGERTPITEPPPSGLQETRPRRRSDAPTDALTDEDIIAAVRGGDQRVARLLHERLVGVVDLTLYRVFGRREPDHDDLIQAVFEQIVRTLCTNSYGRACNLRTWAATLASHVAFTALRSRRRERRVFDRGIEVDSGSYARAIDGESAAAARHDLDHLRRHLVAMNPGRAQVLFLHDVQGEKLNEVARSMRISTAAATSRLVRARRELSNRLDRERARELRKQGLRSV